MLNSTSNWRLAAFDDDLSTDNALLSEEQESAKHNVFSVLERVQDAAAEPLDVQALAAIVRSVTDKGQEEAYALAEEYMRNPIHNEMEADMPEPQIENEISQDQMMNQQGMQNLDSTVPAMAPPPQQAFSSVAAEPSEYAKLHYPNMSVLEAIQSMLQQETHSGNRDPETLQRYALITAEEFYDTQFNTIEDLEAILPNASKDISRMIWRSIQQAELQEDRSLAEYDPDEFVDRYAKYPGHHEEDKSGDKKHLKGEGPVNEKANEIYHAIRRDTDEDKDSAAAIAWSQAKKNKGKSKEKKTYFRGEEAQVLDTYRDMWGDNVSRIRVQGRVIEVAQSELVKESTDMEQNDIERLIDFVESAPKEKESGAEILARIANLKTAMNDARSMLLRQDLSFDEEKALHSIYRRCAAEVEDLDRFDTFVTEEDLERVEELPQFEIGKEVMTSSFTQHSTDWDAAVEDIAPIEDLDKFVREDPILLVSEMSESLIHDAGAVRTHAKKRVASAAAYVDDAIKVEVMSKYMENAENARRSALQAAKIENKQRVARKTASFKSVPDEGLFL